MNTSASLGVWAEWSHSVKTVTLQPQFTEVLTAPAAAVHPPDAFAAAGFDVAVVLWWVDQAMFYWTILAFLTWLLTRTALRRLPPAWHRALWLIVLLKFLIPAGQAGDIRWPAR